MCGILGMLARRGARPDAERFRTALSLMRHRGPDLQNVYQAGPLLLGHNRLSIIDLSDAAAQPFRDRTGRYTMVYNGEIYNFIELRKTLEEAGTRFVTHSDTEVLLEAYKAWGDECVGRLNGMFAFFVWDAETRTGFAARDRFGVKPFYWSRVNGAFLFASEIKPLLALGASRAPNPRYVASFVVEAASDYGRETMLAGVRQLEAGSLLHLDGDGSRERRWWTPSDLIVPVNDDYQARVERYREVLADAVRIRLRSDVQNALTLSGGMDSTSIYASYHGLRAEGVSEALRDLSPYTIRYQGSPVDEVAVVERLTRRYGDQCRYVDVEQGEALSWLWDSAYHLEFPAWNLSSITYLHMYRRIQADGIRVLLEGHGNDEVVGGYHSHVNLAVQSFAQRGQWRAAYAAARAFSAMRNTGVGQRRVPPLLALLYNTVPGLRWWRERALTARVNDDGIWDPSLALRPLPVPEPPGATPFTNHLLHAFQTTILPTVLRVFDRATMASSVEMRAPFMDYRLVQLGFSIPDTDKVGGGFQKRILRDAMRGRLPDEIRANPRKTAFAGDLVNWLNDRRNQARLAEEVLPRVHSGMPVSRSALQAFFRRHCSNGFTWGTATTLSRAVSLVVWWLLFVDGEYATFAPRLIEGQRTVA